MATNQFRVNLFPRDAADCIYNYVVHGSITGTLIDNYTVYESNGVACMVMVFEKHYYRAGNRLTLTVVIDNLNGVTNVRSIGGGGGEGLFFFDWGASESFSNCVRKALEAYIVR